MANGDFNIENENLKAKLHLLARKTGKSTRWHLLRAVEKYLTINGMSTVKERLEVSRSNCVVEGCDSTAGSDACKTCPLYKWR